jgi:hypothetical protein
VSFYVDRAEGRERLSGVTISVHDADGNEVGAGSSDAEGEALVAVPGPGEYEVTIDPSTLPEDVVLREPDETARSVQVFPAQVRPVLFPLEIDDATGEAITTRFSVDRGGEDPERLEGVVLHVNGAGGAAVGSDASDADGVVLIEVPEPGIYDAVIDTSTLPEGVVLQDPDVSSRTVEVHPGQVRAVLFLLEVEEEAGAPASSTPAEVDDADGSADDAAIEEEPDDGGSDVPWVPIAIALLAGGIVIGWFLGRRRSPSDPPTGF